MVKWTEVNVYSGLPKNEDAPTNATGAAVAGTGDDSQGYVDSVDGTSTSTIQTKRANNGVTHAAPTTATTSEL